MVFTSDPFTYYTINFSDRALIWTVWSIRLQIWISRRNLVIFDQFILSLVEIYDITQWVSLTLNWLLNEFHWLKYNNLHDNYLLYNRIVSPNVLSLTLVVYWLNRSDVNTIVKCQFIFLLFCGCVCLVVL